MKFFYFFCFAVLGENIEEDGRLLYNEDCGGITHFTEDFTNFEISMETREPGHLENYYCKWVFHDKGCGEGFKIIPKRLDSHESFSYHECYYNRIIIANDNQTYMTTFCTKGHGS